MIVLILIGIVGFINHTNCLEPEFTRLTPRHGTNAGNSVNTFICPGNGAIVGINFFIDRFISGLQFNCLSVDGSRLYGLFGRSTGTSGKFNCPPGSYISSLYGRSAAYLSEFGVRCRSFTAKDQTGPGEYINFVTSEGGYGAKAGGTQGRDFQLFDDLAYSNGGRPIGAKIWTSAEVEGLQLIYSNAPVAVPSDNNYQEEFTPLYGTETGEIVVFGCANEGAVTTVITKVLNGRLRSIQLGCTSGVGTQMLPVIGMSSTSTAGVTTVQCPAGTIVGSMHGTYAGQVNSLGVRCVEIGETGESPKYDAQGSGSGTVFDGVNYSSKAWRPVLFRIFYDSNGINAMQIKYANSPVNTNCKVTKIEVMDTTIEAVSDGTEVIGVGTAFSCVTGKQVLKLDDSRDVTEDVSITVSDGGDITYATELSVTGTTGFELFGNKLEVSVGLAQSVGGSKQFSSSNTNSTATSTGQVAGTEITYLSPGACLLVGYVNRYKIDGDNVPVRLHYSCETGQMSYELATIKIKSTTYGHAYFEDYQMRLQSEDQCTNEKRACVKSIKANQVAVESSKLVEQFSACFQGVGELHRKR